VSKITLFCKVGVEPFVYPQLVVLPTVAVKQLKVVSAQYDDDSIIAPDLSVTPQFGV